MSRLISTSRGIARPVDEDWADVLASPYPDIGAALEAGVSLEHLAGLEAAERVRHSELAILAPIPRPRTIWALGYAYRAHIAEGANPQYDDEPFFFLKPPASVIGPGQPIVLPSVAPSMVDYEGEIGLVIGRRARSVPAADAWDFIGGLTICNDVSARDVQRGREGVRPNVNLAKGMDTFTPMGPTLVTTDEFPDLNDIGLRTLVDGELRQDARTRDLIFPIPDLVAYLSARTTLNPGDLILTGTPAGVGAPTRRYLQPGSLVRIEVENVGELENPVTAAAS